MAHSPNRRRSARGQGGSGASWISYSDMMAALVLVFVLILCMSLYRYFTMLESKTRELEQQQAALLLQQTQLDEKDAELQLQRSALDEANRTLALNQLLLAQQEASLTDLQHSLTLRENELDNAYLLLSQRESELLLAQAALDTKQAELDARTQDIRGLVGMRAKIIVELAQALSRAGISASVDMNTGEIVLDSAVFFENNSSTIKAEGKALLDRFVPVYLSVLLRPEYSDFMGSIVIEGHTSHSGGYLYNLKISTERALAVANYIFSMNDLNASQREVLERIMTATGRSWSDPVYYYGTQIEDPDSSRRVEFKFSLKDAEMIDEMNRLLQGD